MIAEHEGHLINASSQSRLPYQLGSRRRSDGGMRGRAEECFVTAAHARDGDFNHIRGKNPHIMRCTMEL